MRFWFEYENGYVNIDPDNVYFTRTGNWSETEKLNERKSGENSFRSLRMQWSFTIVATLLATLALYLLITGRIGKLLIECVVGIGSVYYFFAREMGNTFKIPRNKIQSIALNSGKVHVIFLNGQNAPDEVILNGVGPNGLFILKDLSTEGTFSILDPDEASQETGRIF